MRHHLFLLLVLVAAVCGAQEPDASAPAAPPPTAAPVRTEFQVRYISGSNVYIDGGTSSGLVEGTQLILKQSTSLSDEEAAKTSLEPGIVAKLKVVSVASTSAVCEVIATGRDLVENDVLSLPDDEVKKIIDKDALGNTRHYPMVISFSEGDPMDEEVRDTIPRPPLPEVNEARGRFGFDMSTIQELGQAPTSATEYGMVVRADITRIFGTHWNLTGYWRGTFHQSSAAQSTIQDMMNRTYLMSLSYINPESRWSASFGRMYLPYANSLETVDGGYVGFRTSTRTTIGAFFGSSPNPTAWNYDPNREMGGGYFNIHGGSFENLHYSSSVGGGINLQSWSVQRPFLFTENDFSFKKYVSVYEALQIDKPTANPGTAPVGLGIGESLLSARFQVHPRVMLDVTDTYFRDVPTYDPVLVGTGLLDKYLYQGINGGARIQLPMHIMGYFSLGNSNDSNDKKNSMNQLFGATMTNIWKTGLGVDARYSKFDSSFASGTYRTVSLMRDLGERFRLDLQAGRYEYNSSLAAASNSYFGNAMLDMNLGARLFLQSMFTAQRGGTFDYNQWTTVLGYRFDNRAAMRNGARATQPITPISPQPVAPAAVQPAAPAPEQSVTPGALQPVTPPAIKP
jgi:hypothetical protein